MVTEIPRRPYRSEYALDAGEVVLECPWPLRRDEMQDLEEWLYMCLRTIRRVSERALLPEIHPLAAEHFLDRDVTLTA